LWQLLVERDNFGPDPNRQRAGEMVSAARSHYQGKLSRAVSGAGTTPMPQ
jgi:hypothetical protein